MNTEEDWKREREDSRPCRRCHGTGFTPPTYSSGGEPCGCDEPRDEDNNASGYERQRMTGEGKT